MGNLKIFAVNKGYLLIGKKQYEDWLNEIKHQTNGGAGGKSKIKPKFVIISFFLNI